MAISKKLINWYLDNKRNLPWRNTTNPYHIWLSEIILQQTKVEQGTPYYLRFIDKFPNIESLANASEEEVLKTWQGLGYYSRARNLHHTAKEVTTTYQKKFPNNYADILKLKGIGPYTAAAISSFCFKLPHAVLDGNVYRVISRLFMADTPINVSTARKIFEPLAQQLLCTKNPDTYNQAIMELGALVCTPTNPDCDNCPLQSKCLAYKHNCATDYPIKNKAKKARNRYFNYLVWLKDKKTMLQKREQKDIWQGLFEFPLIESKKPLNTEELLAHVKEVYPKYDWRFVKKTQQNKHILSHQHIYSTYWIIEIMQGSDEKNMEWMTAEELVQYPVSKNIERFLLDETVFL